MRYGYKASAEQFGPLRAARLLAAAEKLGLDMVAISDHFQPWRHEGGHAPAALALARRARRGDRAGGDGDQRADPDPALPPVDRRPGLRHARRLAPGRVFLGVGTGEALNETPATGGEFPGAKERRHELARR